MPLSVICVAMAVTVQVVLGGSALEGVSTTLVVSLAGSTGLLLNVTGVPTGHSTVKAPVATSTCSLKFSVMVAPVLTPVAPLVGLVLVTVGGGSPVESPERARHRRCEIVGWSWSS